jgi:hypothetical protein
MQHAPTARLGIAPQSKQNVKLRHASGPTSSHRSAQKA